jgi:NhaP-type Na+/H+ or K+/H+ antiporter
LAFFDACGLEKPAEEETVMLLSLALIFLCGLLMASIFEKLRLPRLLGMILTGILLGPSVLNWLDGSILAISADLRQMALIIILTRAGLSLNIQDLKKVGRPAVLMCFVPACFELGGMLLLAPPLLGISLLDAAIMGAVLGAVSPAVIVPKMLKLMETGYGTKQSIPQMILAGASVDDVFVIVIFTSMTGLAQSGSFSALSFLNIPISIVLGLAVGIGCGFGLHFLFRFLPIRNTLKMLVVLSVGFLLSVLENTIKPWVPLSAMLGVMAMGLVLFRASPTVAKGLSEKFAKLWVPGEILLFVLVGATVDIKYAVSAGFAPVLVILGALCFRVVGVFCCMLGTKLNRKERLFCMVAYLPKATVQAAIGGIPLAMGLGCGQIVLTVAVLGILITAPLGALGIDLTYRRWLKKEEPEQQTLPGPPSGE